MKLSCLAPLLKISKLQTTKNTKKETGMIFFKCFWF